MGRPVLESQCLAKLTVTYNWQRYANQPGADLRYGRCAAGTVRGDQLTIPLSNGYRSEQVQCADRGHGSGIEVLFWYADCTGVETLHGHDASNCTAAPSPALSDPPRHVIAACTDAPRTIETCFTPTGHLTDKVDAPVFVDHWDASACADLDAHGAAIGN